MPETGIQEIETYTTRFQNTATQFIVTRPIVDLCLAAVRRPGAQDLRRWWAQECIDIKGRQHGWHRWKGTEGSGWEK